MSELRDPLLQYQKSVSSEGLQYSFVAIENRLIDIVSAYINLIWEIKNIQKSVKPKDIIINVQTIFKDDDIKKDILWKEHSACTLRELADDHFEQNAKYALKCLPNRNESEQADNLYRDIHKCKSFLNCFSHLKADDAVKYAREILNDYSINSIDEEIFDKICTTFVKLLYELFKFCMRGQ